MSVQPGWYRDPADPDTQRYWDGEQWIGDPIPAEDEPPAGPPAAAGDRPAAGEPQDESAAAGSQDLPTSRPEDLGSPYGGPPIRGMPLMGSPGGPPRTGSIGPPPRPGIAADPYAGRPVTPAGPPGQFTALPASAGPAAAVAPVLLQGRPLAPLGYRLLAKIIDWYVLLGLNIVVNGWLVYQWATEVYPPLLAATTESLQTGRVAAPEFGDRAARLQLGILVISLALWLAYEVSTIASSGQTLGKRALGIKAVGTDGSAVALRQAFARWSTQAAFGVLGVALFGLFGPALLVFDALWWIRHYRLRQCLHDRTAATTVVLVPLGGAENHGGSTGTHTKTKTDDEPPEPQ